VTWRHVYGAAWLAGIGFTMSLFVGDLAYDESPALALSKIGILAASVIAGVGGYLVLRSTRSSG
jgi:NhaA family Na+:H+ antiporter